MAEICTLPVVEANLIRSRIRTLMMLRDTFLKQPDEKTIHDLRVASRRMREICDYLKAGLPEKAHARLQRLGKRVTKSLGRLREAEVNLGILNQWNEERKLDPVALELIIHDERKEYARQFNRARKRIAEVDFEYLNRFVLKVKGSRMLPSTDSEIVLARHADFVGFRWDPVLDDERLHDLRIRTKKFRYAVEIHNRIHKQKLGRFIRKIRNLQEILGGIHDLYVIGEEIRIRIEDWNDPDLHIVPSALKFSYQVIEDEKRKLMPQVFPRYSRVIEHSPFISYQQPAQVAG